MLYLFSQRLIFIIILWLSKFLNIQIYSRLIKLLWEEFEGTKMVIRTGKSKKVRQHNDQEKKAKEQTIYKTLHRKLKIEQY